MYIISTCTLLAHSLYFKNTNSVSDLLWRNSMLTLHDYMQLKVYGKVTQGSYKSFYSVTLLDATVPVVHFSSCSGSEVQHSCLVRIAGRLGLWLVLQPDAACSGTPGLTWPPSHMNCPPLSDLWMPVWRQPTSWQTVPPVTDRSTTNDWLAHSLTGWLIDPMTYWLIG